MSKNATKALENVMDKQLSDSNAKAEKRKDKPGLKQHLIVLKALELAMTEVEKSGDAHSIKLMNNYVKTQHRRLRPWAKVDVRYEE